MSAIMANRIDTSIAERDDVLDGPRAHLDALTGIFLTLARQHAEIRAMIGRVREAPAERAVLWPQIRVSLLAHERGEVRELYPVLRAQPGLETFADHHDAEAKELEEVVARLDSIDVASVAWAAMFEHLAELFTEHVSAEEQGIFPIAMHVLGADRAAEIDERFHAARRRIVSAI